MASNVRITMLGDFHVLINGNIMDDQIAKTKKGCLLLQYLILKRGEPVMCNELYDLLWPNSESTNPESALKTLVSRTRVILSGIDPELGNCIVTKRGGYRYNMNADVEVDMFAFSRLGEVLLAARQVTDGLRADFREMQTLYRGDLLPQMQEESWAMVASAELHKLYLSAVHHYVDLLKKDEDYEEIVRVTRLALDVDVFDEQLNLSLMDALAKTNRGTETLGQYKHTVQIYDRFLGSQPPASLQNYYKHIVNTGEEMEFELGRIRNELSGTDIEKGCFICEYSVFRNTYNLLERALERLDMMVFVVLCRVSSADGTQVEATVMDKAMRTLLNVLCSSLRRGDAVSRYKASEYVILLTNVNYDTCRKVMERIRSSFYVEMSDSGLVMTYKLGPSKGKIV